MGLHNKVVVGEIAPTAGIALSMLHEVDRPVEFVRPPGIHYLSPRLVNHNQRARLQQWVHKPVFRTYISITVVSQFKCIQHHHWQLAPALDHAAQVAGSAEVDPGIERNRE